MAVRASVRSRAVHRELVQLARLLFVAANRPSTPHISLFLVSTGVKVTAQLFLVSCPVKALLLILLMEKKRENLPRYMLPTLLVVSATLELVGITRSIPPKLEAASARCVARQSVWVLIVVGAILLVALWQPTLLIARLLGIRLPVVVQSLLLGILVVFCVVEVSVRCSLAEVNMSS